MSFTKHDTGKLRWSLLFHPTLILALKELVKVLMYGAEKYDDDNWDNCDDPQRYWNAGMRHRVADQSGEYLDKESGLPHMAHMIVSDLFRFGLVLKSKKPPRWLQQK